MSKTQTIPWKPFSKKHSDYIKNALHNKMNVAEGAIPRLLGHPVYYSKGTYKAGTSGSGATPDVIGFAGDWTKAWYGTVEGVKIDISNQATLTISNTAVNLWEHNMFAVKAEIEVGFIADTNVFNRITRTHA